MSKAPRTCGSADRVSAESARNPLILYAPLCVAGIYPQLIPPLGAEIRRVERGS